MKQKLIYLTAFLLSLSLILLLEASSLRFLAEDIKPLDKNEVKVELLLSASNNPAENTQNEADRESSAENALAAELEPEEEVDKNSSEPRDEEIRDKKKENVKKVEAQENMETTETTEAQEIEEELEVQENPEVQKTDAEIIEEKDPPAKTTEEKETAADNRDEPPAWLQNSSNKLEKEKSEQPEANNQKEKFDLDSFIANLEADADENIDQTAENKNQDREDIQSNQDSVSEEKNNNKARDKGVTEDKASANSPLNSNEEQNKVSQENKVYDLRKDRSNSIKKPGIINYSQPEYPSNLRKRNIEGEVIMSLRIDKAGKPHDLKISQSSGYDSFDQAALGAVSNWRFEAAEKDGNKVEVIVNLPIRFKLN